MYPNPSDKNQNQQDVPGKGFRRFLFVLILLCQSVSIVSVGVLVQIWLSSQATVQHPTPTPVVTVTPHATSTPSPTPGVTANQPANLAQRIDAYINHLTQAQQIGQLLMIAVYTNGYTSALNQPLQQWDIANAIMFNNYNGGPLMPTTLSGWTQLAHDLQAHANQALIIATDEEGGIVDRLAPYYGPTPSPQQLAATGNPQKAYAQAQLYAQRLRASGINTDFAPLADVYQGGAVSQSRMFGTTPGQVITYAGAFLDGLQQNGVMGTLKHWPGIGSAPANPDFGLPTITHSQAQLNAVDFATFRALLSHRPGMIMVTHVMVPAYDSSAPA